MANTIMRWLAMISFMILPLAACAAQSQPAMLKELDAETSMLLFSDEQNLSDEKPYYNALLEKNNKCSRKNVEIKIISSQEEEMVKYLDVKSFPSLYVLEGTEVMAKYEGKENNTEIKAFINQHTDCDREVNGERRAETWKMKNI
ncbi:hypothetical protein [Salibacterium aidingense]|uniref:hypothetical protein n=1 Tax=Salibacterium aidingense TaxID=384933 RepID=UPI00047CA62A|nr:hypothetical protein [Salibacterium aidingense]